MKRFSERAFLKSPRARPRKGVNDRTRGTKLGCVSRFPSSRRGVAPPRVPRVVTPRRAAHARGRRASRTMMGRQVLHIDDADGNQLHRKRAVPESPRPESASWNFLAGARGTPSAPSPTRQLVDPNAPPPSRPKPFKPGWRSKRHEPAIDPAAERRELEQRRAERGEVRAGIRCDYLVHNDTKCGVDPITGYVRDRLKAVITDYPPRGGPRSLPMRPPETVEKERTRGNVHWTYKHPDEARAAQKQARPISHWFPYDRVRVVNADP